MRTLIVGDIHGALEVVSKSLSVLREGKVDKVIFLGDFLDSFTRFTSDQITSIQSVLKAMESGENVQTVWGNHDRQYCFEGEGCSGFKGVTDAHMRHLSTMVRQLFKPYLWEQGFLISHAGVSGKLLQALDTTLEDYLDAGDFLQVGRRRGGWNACGGIYWCDWTEFDPILGVKQIFGHSHYIYSGCFKTKGSLKDNSLSINIDCISYDDNPVTFAPVGVIEDGMFRNEDLFSL